MTAATGARNDARRRAREAFQLRCAHHTWDAIAEAKGYGSPAAAHKAVTRHIARMPPEELAMARALAAGTYGMVISQLSQVAVQARQTGKLTNAVEALRCIADVQERHCKLTGVQAVVPHQVEVTINESPATVLRRQRDELIAQMQQAAIQQALPVLDAEVVDDEPA